MNRRDTGYVAIHYKNGDWIGMPFECYDDIVLHWQAGHTFYEGLSYHGAKVCIKLGDLSNIIQYTPDSIKANNEEALEHKTQDTLQGLE